MAISRVEHEEVTIASSGTISGEVDLEDYTLCGVHFPAAMTGSNVAVHASTTQDGTYAAASNGSGAISGAVTVDGYFAFSPTDTGGLRFIKLVSDGAEGAERTLTIAKRKV